MISFRALALADVAFAEPLPQFRQGQYLRDLLSEDVEIPDNRPQRGNILLSLQEARLSSLYPSPTQARPAGIVENVVDGVYSVFYPVARTGSRG